MHRQNLGSAPAWSLVAGSLLAAVVVMRERPSLELFDERIVIERTIAVYRELLGDA